jgi:hypothetical protein
MRTDGNGADAPIDPRRCPACGGDNACANPEGRCDAGTPCWCRDVVFAPALLAALPPAAIGRACVCRACAERAAGPRRAPRA